MYLVTEIHQDSPTNQMDDFNSHREGASYCLKATTVQTAEQKRITEAETSILKLASNHPNVVTLVDVVMRPSGRGRQDHLILMEYCSGGHAFGLIQRMKREVSTHTGMR